MGMFSDLMGKIFAHAAAPTPQAPVAASAPAPVPDSTPEVATPAPVDVAPAAADTAIPAPASPAPTPAAAPQSVDVDAVMSALAAKNSEHLDWKKSIVDMLKLLDMDSSLGARKQLAKELDYPGDENDSATMNVWLHKAVIKKLAENGGKVPQELLV